MIDQFGGDVFNVGRAPTQSLGLDDFMRVMGASTQAPVKYDPEEYIDAPIETGTDATDVYFDQMQRLNDFGMEMARRGIDVLRPGRDPDSQKAAKVFQRLQRQAAQSGVGLRTAHDLRKFYTEQRLKPNVYGPQLTQQDSQGFTGMTTSQDLDRLVDLNPYVQQLNDAVDDINKMALSYDTQVQRDDANRIIADKKVEIGRFKEKMIASGIPNEMADFIIRDAQNRINSATYDPLNEQKLAQDADYKQGVLADRRRRTSMQNKKDQAAIDKDSAGSGIVSLIERVIALNQGRGFDTEKTAMTTEAGAINYFDAVPGEDDAFSGLKTKTGSEVVRTEFDANQKRAFAVLRDPKTGEETRRPLDIDFIMTVLPTQGEREDFLREARANNLIDDAGNLIIDGRQRSESTKSTGLKDLGDDFWKTN